MILNIKYKIYGGDDDQRGQIYKNLNDLISLFHTTQCYSLDTVSVHFSFTKGDKRQYVYLLKTVLHSDQDVRAIICFLAEHCENRGIDFDSIDQLFIKARIVKVEGN